MDEGGQPGAKGSSCRTRSSVMASSIDEREEVIMSDGADGEDRVWQRNLLALARVASLAPAFRKDSAHVRVDDCVSDSLGHSCCVRHNDRAKSDVNHGLAIGASLVDELEQAGRRIPGLVVVEEPVTADVNVVLPVVGPRDDGAREL